MEIIYRDHIKEAYKNACDKKSKINADILNMDGMSGIMTRHFYNNMLNMSDARYLEIGTWKGSSVCSAMFGNCAKIWCIDNWSQFGYPKIEFLQNIEKLKGANQVSYIEQDCFAVDVSILPKFNIYLYDGEHSMESQFKALVHYYDAMDDTFIYIVDDWNDVNVREGTEKAIKFLNLDVYYEKEIRLTFDDTHTEVNFAKNTWWNGVYIVILKKQKQ
jgi:hypothetical protein